MNLLSIPRLSQLASLVLAVWLAACGDGNSDVRHYRVAKAAPAAMTAAPARPGTPEMPANRIPPPPPSPNRLTWSAPTGWQAAPPSSMRVASFRVPLEGGAGECSLVRLAGDAGGLVANINRWRGQIGLAPADEATIRAAVHEGASPLGPFSAVKIANPDAPSGLLAAIFPLGSATLFVKLSAPTAAIDGLEPTFLAFCASIAEAQQ